MNYKLRELSRNDLPEINKWRNNPELISYLGSPFRYIDFEIDSLWYDNYLNNRKNTVRCSIVGENDQIIGIVTLSDIDYINRKCSLHIMIGESNNCNKGIGKFAINEILKHAFDDLNLERVDLIVLESNERAQAVYSKIGFIKEGLLRNYYYKNGKYINAYIMSVLKQDFIISKK